MIKNNNKRIFLTFDFLLQFQINTCFFVFAKCSLTSIPIHHHLLNHMIKKKPNYPPFLYPQHKMKEKIKQLSLMCSNLVLYKYVLI